MNPIDIAIIAVLVGGFIWGFSRGFIYMLFSLLAIIGGVLAASRLTPLLIPIVFKNANPQVAFIVLFVILFTVVYFIIKKLTYLIENLVEFLELEWLDSTLGGVLGLAQFLIICGILLNLAYTVGLMQLVPGYESVRFANFVSDTSKGVINFIAGNLDKFHMVN